MKPLASLATWVLLISISVPNAQAASVQIDREEFVTMLAHVDTMKKALAHTQEIVVSCKDAKTKRDVMLTLREKEIEEYVALAESMNRANKTQDQIITALNQKIDIEKNAVYGYSILSAVASAVVVYFIMSR